jgi:hypothetical protein
LRATFLKRQRDQQGLAILQLWCMAHFDPVDDVAYDPIRQMAADAANVRLSLQI